jgi:hypothetical protein
MKNHPLSMICAYAMLLALIVFGLAGLSIQFVDMLPPSWAPLADNARTAIVVSLAVAFVAAAVASMRSAWHAERAHQAGPEHRHIMWLALGYSAVCIVIEVAIGKLGASMLGAQVSVWALVALLTFFAIAPRLVAVILAGMDGIDRELMSTDGAIEHERTIERIRAVNETTTARIEKAEDRKTHLRAVGMAGAAALVGVSAGVAPEAAAQEQFEIAPAPLPALHAVSTDANLPSGVWAEGPRPRHRAAFVNAMNIVHERPDIRPLHLGRELGVDHKTARRWKDWALAIIAHPENAALFEV